MLIHQTNLFSANLIFNPLGFYNNLMLVSSSAMRFLERESIRTNTFHGKCANTDPRVFGATFEVQYKIRTNIAGQS